MRYSSDSHWPFPAMFWIHVEPGRADDECWEWEGARDRKGYGLVSVKSYGEGLAHRVAYQLEVGPIPDGLQLDHLCRNPPCVNPAHLEPVTNQENARRGLTGQATGAQNRAKTHCPQGHPYAGDNLYVNPQGRRACRICVRASGLAYLARKKEEAL